MALTEEALYACYARLEGPLFNVLYRQLSQREDCEDVIHDAFMRVWARREQIEAASLDALVWTAALNLARNCLRRRRLWFHVALDDDLPAATSDEGDFLARRRVREALRQLPRAARDVLLMSEFSGMSGKEIAAVLRIPAGTVASRKHHGMHRLKQLLEAPDRA